MSELYLKNEVNTSFFNLPKSCNTRQMCGIASKPRSFPLPSLFSDIFSFDTIHFEIHFRDVILCDEFLRNYKLFVNYERSVDKDKDEVKKRRKYYFTENSSKSLNSYEDGIHIDRRNLDVISFEFSVPKYIYGTNYNSYTGGISHFMNYWYTRLSFCSSGCVPHWSEWILKRIDVSFNFELESNHQVKEVLDYFSRVKFWNKSCKYFKNECCYWVFDRRTLKLYDKYQEIMDHKKYHYISDFKSINNNILRFEEEWRSKHLLKLLDLKSTYSITMKRFCDYLEKNWNFDNYMDGFFQNFEQKIIFTNISDIFDLIQVKFKKSVVYYRFLSEVIANGIERTKIIYPPRTFYDCIKKLKDIGIDVYQLSNFIRENQSVTYCDYRKIFKKERLLING